MLKKGVNDFVTFATNTFNALVEKEHQQKGVSDLDFMCRIDISLIKLQDGEYNFVVNEVERSSTINLFYDNFSHEVNTLVNAMVNEVGRYVSRRHGV